MKNLIEQGNVYVGIEFGSTRIKAVMTDENGTVLASGGRRFTALFVHVHFRRSRKYCTDI